MSCIGGVGLKLVVASCNADDLMFVANCIGCWVGANGRTVPRFAWVVAGIRWCSWLRHPLFVLLPGGELPFLLWCSDCLVFPCGRKLLCQQVVGLLILGVFQAMYKLLNERLALVMEVLEDVSLVICLLFVPEFCSTFCSLCVELVGI